MNDFEEYIRQGEPQKREKGYAWQTAIGLQAVDALKPSEYLIQTARQHIEGDITIYLLIFCIAKEDSVAFRIFPKGFLHKFFQCFF